MTSVTPVQEVSDSAVTRFESRLPKGGPVWLRALRESAFAQLGRLGFPTTRSEEWRFLDVSPITQLDFSTSDQDSVKFARRELERITIPGMSGCRFVFVNGRYREELSDLGALSKGVRGVRVLDIAEDMVQAYLGQYADDDDASFTALNTAMVEDCLCLHVSKGHIVDEPIHVLHVTVPQDKAVMTNPRILVVADESSQVSIVEDYVSSGNGVHFTNAVTEFIVGQNATAAHYLLARENLQAFNISTLQVQQLRDSNFTSHSALLGGAIVRNNINLVLAGEGCDSLINGLYVVGGDQVVDNHMRVEHAQPHGNSRQFYKGIMSERSRGMFRGRIIVRPGAQKTDAVQSNKNLLLCDDASVHSDPQLEIYADDVKCTHGSTTGQIDEEAIFYLRSRGIGEQAARRMLIHAFANDGLDRMQIAPIRTQLAGELTARLSR